MLRRNLDHIANLLHEAGIVHWAVSPGSRNAPVVAGMIRHGGFFLHSFPDERSAAFAALGMAQASGYTCGVICTSGTAVLNLYPGICEAYYQRVPLLVLTADRPGELIDQWDGQTIHQQNIFEKHILQSVETPQDLDEKEYAEKLGKLIYAAAEKAMSPVRGPVHINLPLRDPIYAGLDAPFQKQEVPPFIFQREKTLLPDEVYLQAELKQFERVLILAGQHAPDAYLKQLCMVAGRKFPFLADVNSNLSLAAVPGWEMALQTVEETQDLQPDLLISFGLSVTSKKLKNFLKCFPPAEHWHLSTGGFTGDPFQSKPQTRKIDPHTFLEALNLQTVEGSPAYRDRWLAFGEKGISNMAKWPEPGSVNRREMEVIRCIMQHSDESITLQVGNSMAIRYAGWAGATRADFFCNRGTSGIDGSLSTAAGYALKSPDKKVICVLGDISFLYDIHGLWTDKIPENLKIVVLNNGGGKIFEFIDGPAAEPRLKPLIQTPQGYDLAHLAAHYQLPFTRFENTFSEDSLIEKLQSPGSMIIEYTFTH